MKNKSKTKDQLLSEPSELRNRVIQFEDFQSEEKYKQFFQTSRDCVFITTKDGRWIDVNDAGVELFGYSSREELMQVNVSDLYAKPEERAKHINIIAENGFTKEFPVNLLRKDGTVIHALITSLPRYNKENNVIGFQGTIRDITEREQVEQALRESEERFKQVANNANELIWEVDTNGVYRYCSLNVEKVLGYSADELVGQKHFYDLFAPDVREELKDKAFAKFQRKEPFLNFVNHNIHKNGTLIILKTSGTPILDKKGGLLGYRGVDMDMTEQNKVEAILKEKLEELGRLATVISDSNDAIILHDFEGKILAWNHGAKEIYGYTETEALGMNVKDIVAEADREAALTLIENIKQGDIVKSFELRRVTKDGRILDVWLTITLLTDEKGKPVAIAATERDITEHKQSEDELRTTLEKLRKGLACTIQVMSLIVEVRDPYTSGHQKRVANLARTIAQEMGLPKDTIDNIRIAGIVHDIGKMSIPAEILSKPTKLTNIEMSFIKIHPQSGYDILKDVGLPYPVAEIVLQHHEKLDGSGYPQGLKKDQILLETKIICVADVVEAIASHRPYRPGLGIDIALEEIEKNKGILYDAGVVEVCVRLFREKAFIFE
jgi:PAS domain S-box-containing protein/putative nucleotidyltransferase with HDIG domain